MSKNMKHNKFDFFKSPHPQSFDFNRHRQHPLRQQYQEDYSQSLLFQHLNPCPKQRQNQDYYENCMSHEDNNYYSSQQYQQNQQNNGEYDEYSINNLGVTEKINLLQECGQIKQPMTPQRKIRVLQQEQDLQVTIRRNTTHNFQQPQLGQTKIYERGLKRLANQAFKFVCQQKRTTYKQVARKLIGQLIINQNQFQKRGQMNIKRRIYDALNVLIALGLLKRIGNKIIVKKVQPQFQQQRLSGNQKNNQQNLVEQCKQLNEQYLQKQNNILQKQKTLQALQMKRQILRQLIERNKKYNTFQNKKIIQFPFFSILSKQVEQMKMQKQSIEVFYHGTKAQIKCPNINNIQVLGQLDIISLGGNIFKSQVKTQNNKKKNCK